MSDNTGIKVTRQRGYTVVYNDLLPDDGSLTARAWGVYCYLLSRPDGWETRVGHLRTVFKEGRDAIYRVLNELVIAGLMGKEEYLENGLRRTRYTLDADQLKSDKTAGQPPEPASQDPGTQDAGSQDADVPDAGKPGQVSKERTTTDPVTDDSLRSSPADEPSRSTQPALIATPDGPNATRNNNPQPDSTPRLSAEEKAGRRAQAEGIARGWRVKYEEKVGKPASWQHIALRNMIEKALANYSELEIKRALVALGRPLPSAREWQDALLGVRNGASVNGKPIANRHHEAPDSENRQARIAALEAG